MPRYTDAEVNQTLPLFQPVLYTKPTTIFDDITVIFHDAGHILGSAMIEVEVRQPEGSRRVVFSGDIGQADKPFIRDPALLERADYVIMESTYGDRRHKDCDTVEIGRLFWSSTFLSVNVFAGTRHKPCAKRRTRNTFSPNTALSSRITPLPLGNPPDNG